jgi:hypothetical protein
VKPDVNSIEVHPQLSHNKHPVDDELVGAGSVWMSSSRGRRSNNNWEGQKKKGIQIWIIWCFRVLVFLVLFPMKSHSHNRILQALDSPGK